MLYIIIFFESAFMLKGLTDYDFVYQYSARCVICHYDKARTDCACLCDHGVCDRTLHFDQSFVHGQVKKWYDDIHAMRVPHISFGFFEHCGHWSTRNPYIDVVEAYLLSVNRADLSQKVYIAYWQRVADHFKHYHFFMPFF